MPKPLHRSSCLREVHRRFAECDTALLTDIFDYAMQVAQEDFDGSGALLLSEVEEMALMLERARAEITAIGADDISVNHIPSATDELDAIVVHTATATNIILESCELIDELATGFKLADKEFVRNVVTQIYEACTFQDITGQRITKVVATLKIIEAKVAHIVKVFAPIRTQATDVMLNERTAQPLLLNGPQLHSVAMGQGDVDALMAGFD